MPKTIVVPLDGSEAAERALGPAARLAARFPAEVVVMTAQWGGVVVDPHAYLEEAARRAGLTQVETQVVPDTFPQTAIARLVHDVPDPVVCMSTHGRTGLGHAFLGNVAEEVIQRVETPLVLVGPTVVEGELPLANLVVCVEGSRVSREILPVAEEWARALDLAVWLVQVIDPDAGRRAERATGEHVVEEGTLMTLARTMEHDGLRVNWEELHGVKPAEAIVDFARVLPASLIAMTTHTRVGLERVVLGSVAMSVVRSAPCPVLVVRPR